MSDVVLSVNNLSKSFSGLKAVNDISFDLREEEIMGLIGPNGSGKSTTFNLISGILPADTGSVKVYGTEVIHSPPHKISSLGMSRTFQNTRLWRELTVLENLLIAPKKQIGASILNALSPWKYKKQEHELIEKAYTILKLLEIDHMAENYASELSGGQSKLVDIGRLLMSDAKILMLDEPVAGVAGPLTEKIFQMLKKLRNELSLTIVIIEHNMDFILRKGIDHVVVMANGTEILNGTPEGVRKSQDVIDAYLGE